MNIFELAAEIKLDSSSFEKGLQKSERYANRLADVLSAKTVAAGQIMAQMVQGATSKISSVISGAINEFADYEQFIGGVEKIFGSSADTVILNAEKAYKTAGVSANDYMQTVIGFSASLLQSLGGDTEEAATLANQAVIDMSDNANTFGTNIESIQAAYQGFARGNFTMLDNLKLGYGGTADEMLRLVNDSGVLEEKVNDISEVDFATIINAIHVMQEQMGIAGTTAEEAATTISGSKGSMVAAWDDLLSSLGQGDQERFSEKMANFEESFGTYMKNMIPRAIGSIGGSGALIEGLATALSGNITEEQFAQLGVSIETAITGVFEGLTNVGQWLINGLTTAFQSPSVTVEGAGALGESIGNFISTTISGLFENGGSILSGVVTTAFNLGKGIFEGLFNGFFGGDETEQRQMEEALGIIDDTMRESMQEASNNAEKGNAIVAYLDELIDKYGDSATKTNEWKEAVIGLEQVLPNAKGIIEDHKGDINGVTEALGEAIEGEKDLAIAAAQRAALQEKLNALAVAKGELGSAQGALDSANFNLDFYRNAIFDNPIVKWGLSIGDLDDSGGWLNALMGYKGDDFAGNVRKYFSDTLEYGLEENIEGVTEENLYALAAAMEQYNEASQTVQETSSKIADLKEAVKMAEASYNTANAALNAWAASLPTINITAPSSGGSTKPTKESPAVSKAYGHATGLDFVPFDNYLANLHRGEAVLTSAEASEWRKGSGKSGSYTLIADMIGASVERALGKAGIYMDGSRVGQLTTRTVAANIRTESALRTRAMGG